MIARGDRAAADDTEAENAIAIAVADVVAIGHAVGESIISS